MDLWVSQPTDFKYPEFLEIKWEQAKDLSRVEITFDPSYDFIFDKKPRSYDTASIPSLIKEYKLYYYDLLGHSICSSMWMATLVRSPVMISHP